MIIRASHRDLASLLVTCPCCSDRTRASTMVATWSATPRPSFDDTELALTNQRGPLWTIGDTMDYAARRHFGSGVFDFFATMKARCLSAAAAAELAGGRVLRL